MIADHVCRVILNRRCEHGVHACLHTAFKDSRCTLDQSGRRYDSRQTSCDGRIEAEQPSLVTRWLFRGQGFKYDVVCDLDVEQISFLGVAVAVSVDLWALLLG